MRRLKDRGSPFRYIPPRFAPALSTGPATGTALVTRKRARGSSAAAGPLTATLRAGFFVRAGTIYSGGRIMLTMYALGLARAGAEVWFVTDGKLAWRDDFEWPENFHFARLRGKLPPDLDLLVTDCRGHVAKRCLEYKKAHPGARLVVVAFETPNWTAEYSASLAALQEREDFRTIERSADRLGAISHEGAKYLRAFYADDKPIDVIYPAMNTEAIDRAVPRRSKRPYLIYVARPTKHKHPDVAVRAVHSLAEPMDLMMITAAGLYRPKSTGRHKVVRLHQIPDERKFALMKGARALLAPSSFEGFGMVPGEALICGTPVVAYDLPVLREAYGDDLTYVPHDNADAFVAAVQQEVMGPKPRMREVAARTRKRFGLDSLPERIQRTPFHAVKRTRLSVALICYATPGVTACLAALYPQVDEIHVSYGPVPFWKDSPEGGVLEEIRAFPDPQHKITVEAREVWADKREMWMSCASRITGNYLLLTAADMVWVGLEHWLKAGHKFATPRWVNLWHSARHWIYGEDENALHIAGHALRWGQKLSPFGSVCNHHLFSLWRPSYRWNSHTQPKDSAGNSLFTPVGNMEAAIATPETVCYHFGHALPEQYMRAKHEFYIDRDGQGDAKRLEALEGRGSMWHDWEGELGPYGDGIIGEVDWELPESLLAAVPLLDGEPQRHRDTEKRASRRKPSSKRTSRAKSSKRTSRAKSSSVPLGLCGQKKSGGGRDDQERRKTKKARNHG